MAGEAKPPEPAGYVPRDPEALRAYLDDRLSQALARPRFLGAEGVQMIRGFRAYLALLDAAGLQKLSDCFAVAEYLRSLPPDAFGVAGGAPDAQPVGDFGTRDRQVRCIDATSRRPLIWWGQDYTDMLNLRGYLQSLQGEDLARLEGYRGAAGAGGDRCPKCGGTLEPGRYVSGQDETHRSQWWNCPKCDYQELRSAG